MNSWRMPACLFAFGDGPRARAEIYLTGAEAEDRAVWRGRLVAFTVFRRAAAPKRARHPTERSEEGLQSSGAWPPPNRALWRGRLVAFAVFRSAAAPKRARHPTELSGEDVFSRVYSLPEGGRPEARVASNRAVWRGRLEACRVFRRAAAPKRAASNKAVWRERVVAFTVFCRVGAPKRARPPHEQSGECV